MITAIHQVMDNKIYICSEITDLVSDNNQALPGTHSLSLREIEITQHVKLGCTSKEIANKLHISVRTAEAPRRNILKKLNLKNTVSLIKYIENADLFV